MRKAGCLLLVWALMPTQAFAGTGAASVYQITVREVDVSQDGGTNWTPVGSASSSFDIASAAVGDALGNYISQAAIPDGSYNAVRVIITNTIAVKGTAVDSSNGRTYCTDSDGTSENSVANPATCPSAPESQSITVAAAPPGGFPSGVSLDLPNTRILIVDTSFRLTVDQGLGGTFLIAFNVSSGVGIINGGSGIMYPGAPVVTISQLN